MLTCSICSPSDSWVPVFVHAALFPHAEDLTMIFGRFRPSQTRTNQRRLSNGCKEYIEQWQASTVKPNSFYEHHGIGKPKKYFYHIDLQGRIFLEETQPKSIATSLKSPAFLDFFISNIKESTAQDLELLPECVRVDYPYVSRCGVELNFVRPADSPIVFHSMDGDTPDALQLYFAASLRQRFDPRCLAISPRTGHLYHQLLGHGTSLHRKTGCYGLIKSSVAVALSEQIIAHNDEIGSGTQFAVGGCHYPIPWLPGSAEPGSWAMPFFAE